MSEQSRLGKNIRLFLVDGTPTGLVTAEVMNWTGKAVRASRARLPELLKLDDIKRNGLYFLIGDPEDNLKPRVYVGQGSVPDRLYQHSKDERKEFWHSTVVFVSKDENLTTAHTKYLEGRLFQKIVEADRVTCDNGNQPSTGNLPEADKHDMEYFLLQIELVMPMLGYGFLRPKPTASAASDEESGSPLLCMNHKGTNATAREIDGEFVVFKGSTASKETTASHDSYRALRARLLDEGKLLDHTDNPDLLVFPEDVAFRSPSAAATIVRGGNMNGRTAWRVKETGRTYKEWQEDKLADIDVGEGADDS